MFKFLKGQCAAGSDLGDDLFEPSFLSEEGGYRHRERLFWSFHGHTAPSTVAGSEGGTSGHTLCEHSLICQPEH